MTVHTQRPSPNDGYQRPGVPPVQSTDYKPEAIPVTPQANYVLPAATNVNYEAPLRPDTSYVAPKPETSYVAPKPEASYVQPNPSYITPIQDTSYGPSNPEPSLTETSYPLQESYHAPPLPTVQQSYDRPPAPLPSVLQSGYGQPAVVYHQQSNISSSNESQQAPVIYIIQLHT